MIASVFLIFGFVVITASLLERYYVDDYFVDFFQLGAKSAYLADEYTAKLITFYLVFFALYRVVRSLLAGVYHFHSFPAGGSVPALTPPASRAGDAALGCIFGLNILSLFLVYGGSVFYSPVYHDVEDAGFVHILYKISLMIGLIFIAAKPRKSIYWWAALIIMTLLSLSIATRLTGVAFIVASIFHSSRSRLSAILHFLAGTLLVILVMYFRGYPSHGLLSYLNPYNFDPENVGDIVALSASYVFNFSFNASLASYEQFLSGLLWLDILTMINPLPGFLTNWYEISSVYSLTEEAPFSALGLAVFVLYNSAFGFLLVLYVVLLVAVVDVFLARLRSNQAAFILVASFGLMFVIYSAQYDLRTALRYLYYAIAVALVFEALRNTRFVLGFSFGTAPSASGTLPSPR